MNHIKLLKISLFLLAFMALPIEASRPAQTTRVQNSAAIRAERQRRRAAAALAATPKNGEITVEDAITVAQSILMSYEPRQASVDQELLGRIKNKIDKEAQKNINHRIEENCIQSIVDDAIFEGPEQAAAAQPTSARTARNTRTSVDKNDSDTKTTDASDYFAVPEDLFGKVIHMRVIKQKGSSCGWHAMFNTKAIKELFEHKQEITPKAIENITKENHQLITPLTRVRSIIKKVNGVNTKTGERTEKRLELEIEDIQRLNAEFKIDLYDTYCIRYDEKQKDITCQGIVQSEVDFDQNPDLIRKFFNECLDRLRDNQQEAAYFMINTGGHWVQAAYLEGILVYTDSMNTQIKDGSTAHRILQKLIEHLEPIIQD